MQIKNNFFIWGILIYIRLLNFWTVNKLTFKFLIFILKAIFIIINVNFIILNLNFILCKIWLFNVIDKLLFLNIFIYGNSLIINLKLSVKIININIMMCSIFLYKLFFISLIIQINTIFILSYITIQYFNKRTWFKSTIIF